MYERLMLDSDWYRDRMREIDDMPVSQALASGLAFKCPTCGLIHPGILCAQDRAFCTQECYNFRDLLTMRDRSKISPSPLRQRRP